MPTKQQARQILDTYIRAWETQDPGIQHLYAKAAISHT